MGELTARVARRPAVGDRIGAYRLETMLGEGASSVVFRARRDDGADIALKVLKPHLSRNRTALRRFQREARVATAVEHPSLVRFVDTGRSDGRYFLASAFVEGPSLEQRLRAEGELPLAEALLLLDAIAGAVDALHRAQVI